MSTIHVGDLVTLRGLPVAGIGLVVKLRSHMISRGTTPEDAIRTTFADVMWPGGRLSETMVDNLIRLDEVMGDM